MTLSLRLLAAGLVLAVPMSASATPPGNSVLDRQPGMQSVLPHTFQDDAPPPVELAPLPPDAAPVPIDGGLSLLALAGAGLAAKRLRKRRA